MDDALKDLIVCVGDGQLMTEDKEREIANAVHAALRDGRVTRVKMLDNVVHRASIYIPQAFTDFTRYMIKYRLLCLDEVPELAARVKVLKEKHKEASDRADREHIAKHGYSLNDVVRTDIEGETEDGPNGGVTWRSKKGGWTLLTLRDGSQRRLWDCPPQDGTDLAQPGSAVANKSSCTLSWTWTGPSSTGTESTKSTPGLTFRPSSTSASSTMRVSPSGPLPRASGSSLSEPASSVIARSASSGAGNGVPSSGPGEGATGTLIGHQSRSSCSKRFGVATRI